MFFFTHNPLKMWLLKQHHENDNKILPNNSSFICTPSSLSVKTSPRCFISRYLWLACVCVLDTSVRQVSLLCLLSCVWQVPASSTVCAICSKLQSDWNHLSVTALTRVLPQPHHFSSCCISYSLSSAASSSLYALRSCCLRSLTSLSGFSEVLCSSACSTLARRRSNSAQHLFASSKRWISESWVLLIETLIYFLCSKWILSGHFMLFDSTDKTTDRQTDR